LRLLSSTADPPAQHQTDASAAGDFTDSPLARRKTNILMEETQVPAAPVLCELQCGVSEYCFIMQIFAAGTGKIVKLAKIENTNFLSFL
jgi:hypothetical protein